LDLGPIGREKRVVTAKPRARELNEEIGERNVRRGGAEIPLDRSAEKDYSAAGVVFIAVG
jgi:hypothetical protein